MLWLWVVVAMATADVAHAAACMRLSGCMHAHATNPPSPSSACCPPTDALLTAFHLRFHSQVWDYARSADSRDTEGGASKRSLLEQVAKMRAYLADTA